MSYQVLARKWRPKNFSQLMGQEHVVTVLVNALMQERLHHAYLFTGTRGVGKTTIARIFAKSLNCQKGISAEPCGQCDVCEDVDIGRFVDLIEIDAASRTKVDDTREILDNVQYAPSRGRFKVYLIDEVHMLSKSSFNALLKTLEEPPPHVKFILATTDPQKLPVTVLSRCLQFHLKALTPQQIERKLTEILTAENVTFEEGALGLLAKAARGSMRDSLSLTDQAIAQGQGHIELGNLQQMLGGVDQNWVFKILIALIKQDAKGLLELSKNIASFAPSYPRLMADLLQLLHQVALWQLVPNSVDVDAQRSTLLTKFASAMAPEDVQLYYQIVLNGRKDLPYAGDEQAGFDMVILRLLAFRPAVRTDSQTSVQSVIDASTNSTTFDEVVLTDTIKPIDGSQASIANKSKQPEETLQGSEAADALATQNPDDSPVADVIVDAQQESPQHPAVENKILSVERNQATSAEQLDIEQQALEQQAEQAKQDVATLNSPAQVDVQTPTPESLQGNDFFRDAPTSDVIENEPVQEVMPQAVTKHVTPEQALPVEPSAEQTLSAEQTPEQALSAEATPEQTSPVEATPEQALPAEGQSEVDKMLSARNMLRSRKKVAEGGVKKSEASIAAKARTPRAMPAQNAPSETVDTIVTAQPSSVTTPACEKSNPAKVTPSTSGLSEDQTSDLSDVPWVVDEQEVALASRPVLAERPVMAERPVLAKNSLELEQLNSNEMVPHVESTAESTAENTASDTAEAIVLNLSDNAPALTSAPTIAKGLFDEDLIDPKNIRDANQIDVWANTIDAMGLTGRVRQLALNAIMGQDSNDEQLVINLDKNFGHLNSAAALEQITKCYVRLKQSPCEVFINAVDNIDAVGATPFYIQNRINAKRLQYAQNIIANDKFINALQEEFNAFVEENSIEPL